MAKPTRSDAQRLMNRLKIALKQRAQLDLEIVKLQNSFGAFARDAKIALELGGCQGPKYSKS